MSVNTTAPTYIAGTVLTAANLNTVVDGMQAAWDSYTPTWTATSNPAIGNGTLVGRYLRVGKTIHYRIQLTAGSTTSYGTGNWNFGLPVAAHASYTINMHIGDGVGLDLSAIAYNQFTTLIVNSTSLFLITQTGTTVGQLVPWTWASGDKLSLFGTYEAA